MTRLSYARVLIEVDLLGDLPSSVNIVLPNDSTLVQQVQYESLPHLCKLCHVLGHSDSAYRKDSTSKCKTKPQDFPEGSGSPSTDTEVVEKQQPYSQGPLVDTLVDPMSTEVVTSKIRRCSSLECKRTNASGSTPYLETCENLLVLQVTRQYLTKSKVNRKDAQVRLGKSGTTKGTISIHCISDSSEASLSM
ncbi:hypothetical protein NC651_035531 [Populus alba x Populus x berolinensis]|nr:hypothetical protein NC651_035531 [Populus alba x Populus x berolinensis]